MLVKNNGMYAYQHKRGDTFEFSGVIDVKHQGQTVPDLTDWLGKSQLRKQSGELIADLMFTWIDATQRVCNIKHSGSTADWPICVAQMDIEMRSPDNHIVSTQTTEINIAKDVTRANA